MADRFWKKMVSVVAAVGNPVQDTIRTAMDGVIIPGFEKTVRSITS